MILKTLCPLILIFSNCTFANEAPDLSPYAYAGAYSLNHDGNTLKYHKENYGINHINVGFLMLPKGGRCLYENLTDGSGIHPIDGHISHYKDYVESGGEISVTLSGATNAIVDDPLVICSKSELVTLLQDIDSSLFEINERSENLITLDIESEDFRLGHLGDEFYNKIIDATQELRNSSNLNFSLTFPLYSSHWSGGYNEAFKKYVNKFSQDENLGPIDIMYFAKDISGLKEEVSRTKSHLDEETDTSKLGILLLVGNNEYRGQTDESFNSEELKEEFSDHKQIVTIITHAHCITKGNSKLHSLLNNPGYGIEDPDGYSCSI